MKLTRPFTGRIEMPHPNGYYGVPGLSPDWA